MSSHRPHRVPSTYKETVMNNRRVKRSPLWTRWIGDMNIVTEYLLKKPWLSFWVLPKTLNAILRAVGTVAFANNPVTGLFIVAGMFAGDANVGFACLLAGVLGVICSKILKQPEIVINDGVSIFNGILVGCIAVAVFPSISGHDLCPTFWGYIAAAIAITAYIDKGLNALMAASTLPAYSLPFNLTAAILLLTMRSSVGLQGRQMPGSATIEQDPVLDVNMTQTIAVNNTQEIEWAKVMEGTLLAAGQIYGVGTIDSSILIYLGFFFYSPLLTIFFYFGSLIGTLIGILASVAPYTDVYLGLWGYNAMLTAGGIAYFLVPTPTVTLAAVVGAALAAAVQAATLHMFSAATVPVFSYPFNIAILLITAISTTPDPPFKWVAERSYPEKHIIKYYRSKKTRKVAADNGPEVCEPFPIVMKYKEEV